MPPVLGENDDSMHTYGSHLELALITAAVCITFLLTHIPSAKALTQIGAGPIPLFFAFIIHLCFISSLLISITSLVLGWTRKITLEAVAAVIFSVVPGLARMPTSIIQYAYWRLGVALRRCCTYQSLDKADSEFWCIRVGRPCGCSMKTPKNCTEGKKEKCDRQLYCMKYTGHYVHILKNLFWCCCFSTTDGKRRCFDAKDSHSDRDVDNEELMGTVIGHSTHTVQLSFTPNEDLPANFHIIRTAASALWLVTEPRSVFLTTREQVLTALNLIVEVGIYGELAFFVRFKYINDQIDRLKSEKNVKKWQDLPGRAALVHKSIIKTLNLAEWMPENYRHFLEQNSFLMYYQERQSMLFYLLVEKSNVFRRRVCSRTSESAVKLVDRVMKLKCKKEELNEKLYDYVDSWLKCWGCDEKDLNASEKEELHWEVAMPRSFSRQMFGPPSHSDSCVIDSRNSLCGTSDSGDLFASNPG